MEIYKRIFVITVLLFATSAAIAADKEIPFSELPSTAQAFVKTHFDRKEVLRVSMDVEYMVLKEYTVFFRDGTQIEFNSDGKWEEVKRKLKAIPMAIIPTKITAYIKRSFPDTFVQKIEKQRSKIEVEISNGLDLEFDNNGAFLRIDD